MGRSLTVFDHGISSHRSKSTSRTPNLVIFGRELNCPIDLMIRTPDQNNFCPSEYLDWLQNAMRHTFNFVYEHSHQAATRQKNNYDIGLKPQPDLLRKMIGFGGGTR